MSRGPELPTVNQLAAIAQDFMLDMTLEDLTNQRDAMRGAIASLRHIDDMPEERPAVAYPRTSVTGLTRTTTLTTPGIGGPRSRAPIRARSRARRSASRTWSRWRDCR